MDEDIIIPKKSSKVPVSATENPEKLEDSKVVGKSEFNPNSRKKKPNLGLIFGILAGVLILGGGITYFALNNSPSDNPSEDAPEKEETGTSAEVEVVYVTPEDSEDPVGDFTNHLEEEKSKASTDEEKFEAELSLITFNITIEKYDEALAGLNNFDTSNFSEEDWYRYYNTYVNYYKSRGLDEENALLDEYSAKAADAYNRLVNEVDESEKEETEDAE